MPRLIVAGLVGLLIALSGHAAELRIAIAGDVTTVDPHAVNIAPNNNIGWHIFDALTHVDERGRLTAGLATSWRAVNPTTWEFHLRRGVKFHDGSEFVATDAIASLERPLQVRNSQFATFVLRIVAKQIVDAYTIRLQTAQPYAVLPLDLNSIFIIPARLSAASTEDFNSGRATIGTGPFKFVSFKRGESVELRRNDQYWGGPPDWERLIFRMIPVDHARIAALIAGDIDLIDAVPTADVAALLARRPFTIAKTVSWRTLFFHLDQRAQTPPLVRDKERRPLNVNPFRSRSVRLALSMAINRQAIVEHLMDGAALPASNLVAPSIFGYAADLQPTPFNPEEARRLLREAGYPEGFDLVLDGPNNRYVNDARIAQAVAGMFTRVGVTSQVVTMPMNAYLPKARNGELAVMMLGWGSFSGDLALRALAATPDAKKGNGAWNWSHYSNAGLDSLIEQALGEVDDSRRERLAQDAMRLAMGDVAMLPLHHQFAIWAMRDDLSYQPRTDEFTFAHHVHRK